MPDHQPLTREAIVSVARRLLSELGFEQMSLRRLATELGVTAPALYAHVDDKNDLLAALADAGFRELVERYRSIDTPDPLDRLRAQIEAYVAQAQHDPHLFHVMFRLPPRALATAGTHPELPAASAAFEPAMAAVVEAIAAGMIHPSRDAMTVALSLWTTAHGLATVTTLGVPGDAAGRAALQESVVTAVLVGLAAPAAAERPGQLE
jgi:AcrR family transcriptional regulator